MNETHVYVGDNKIDLKTRSVVAISVKNIEIGELNARYITRTNRITGIWTENSKVALSFSGEEKSQTTKPYSILSGKVVQNGIEIIPNARIIIRKSKKDEFDLDITESFYDFFSEIDGLSIKDIYPIALSIWTASAIDSARLNTSGIVSVIVNWGKSGGIYQYNYFLPCFYYHSFITAILEFTGLTLSGSILTDDRFTDLVIPFFGEDFEYSQPLVDGAAAKALNDGQVVVDLLAADGVERVELDSTSYGTMMDLANDQYQLSTSYPALSLTITAFFSVNTITWGNGTTITAKLYQYSVSETELASLTIATSPAASGTATLTYTGTFLPGDLVYMGIISNSPGPAGVTFSIVNTTYLQVSASSAVQRETVSWNDLFSSVSCVDLIKDFFVRFSIIPKQSENTLYLKSIEEIIADRSGAIDWSAKLVDTGNEEINFNLGYAQDNNFLYDDSETGDEALGRGVLELSNSVIQVSKEIYKSIFNNSVTETTSGYNVATIPVYDADSTGIETFANEPGLRLLTLKDRTTESSVTFNATPRTDYKLGYFVDPLLTKDTGWQYFIDEFYASLSLALQKNKIVIKYFNLTEIDIKSYDPHKLVWDGNDYYIVNQIFNFIPGEITKVELFKVS